MSADFPESFFTLLNQLRRVDSTQCEAPSLLEMDPIPQLSGLYPDRSSFHAFEVYAFESFLASAMFFKVPYAQRSARLTSPERLIEGKWRFLLLEHVKTANPEAFRKITPRLSDSFEPEGSIANDPKMADCRVFQTEIVPEFRLKQSEELYRLPAKMDPSLMSTLLAADRDDLIADLETILDDCATRFFLLADNRAIKAPAIHALILLCFLQADQSVPTICRFLSRPSALVDYWLGDAMTEYLGLWLALLLEENLHAFDDLILNEDVNMYVRGQAVRGFEQIGLHSPDRIPELEQQLLSLMEAANQNNENADEDALLTLNTNFGYVANSLGIDKLQPMIDRLIDQDLIDIHGIEWDIMVRSHQKDAHGNPKDRLHLGDLRGMYSEMNFLHS